jgi:hypothetical protein
MRTVGRAGVAAAALALLVPAAGGCGSDAAEDDPSRATGVLHGHILGTGGPVPDGVFDLPGVVVAARGSRVVARGATPDGSEYRLRVPPGRYRLTVQGAAYCAPRQVDVTAGSDQSVDLTCQLT